MSHAIPAQRVSSLHCVAAQDCHLLPQLLPTKLSYYSVSSGAQEHTSVMALGVTHLELSRTKLVCLSHDEVKQAIAGLKQAITYSSTTDPGSKQHLTCAVIVRQSNLRAVTMLK